MFSIFCLFIVLSVTKIECLEEMEFRNEQPRTLNLIKKDVSSWILGKICNISSWIFHHFSKLRIFKFSKDKLAYLANEQHDEESDNWHIDWMFKIYEILYTTYSALYVGIVFDLLPVYDKIWMVSWASSFVIDNGHILSITTEHGKMLKFNKNFLSTVWRINFVLAVPSWIYFWMIAKFSQHAFDGPKGFLVLI